MSTDYAITTQDLTFHFGENRAITNLSLSIKAGEIYGLLGHNGAGKTTTIRLLTGLLSPLKGVAHVLGWDTTTDDVHIRQHIGVLTETPSLDERLSGRDNLSIYANIYGVPIDSVSSAVNQLLETFDLSDRAAEKVANYSKGMKQRLALARALIHQPKILFLDEPTSALDPVASRQVHELIMRLSRVEGRTVVLCTHNLVEAQQLCDRVAVLYQGRLLAEGVPASLSAQLATRQRLTLETLPEVRVQAVAVIQAVSGLAAEIDSAGFITVAGATREQVPELINALSSAGIPLYRAVPQEATLADVYFALHEHPEVES